jgi:hypothetical protein
MDKWFKDILPDKYPYHNRGRDQMRKKGVRNSSACGQNWMFSFRFQITLKINKIINEINGKEKIYIHCILLSDYQTFGLSDLWTIGPSDYRTFGLLDLRTIVPSPYPAPTFFPGLANGHQGQTMVTDVDFYFVQEPRIFHSFHQSASFDVLFSSSENNMHAIRSYIFYTELIKNADVVVSPSYAN